MDMKQMAVHVLSTMVVPAGVGSVFAIWWMLEGYRMQCGEGAEVVMGRR